MSNSKVHLEHALVDVRDLETSLGFYARLLPGWGVRWQGRSAEGGRWAHFGPAGAGQPGYLSLYETPEAAPASTNGSQARIEHLGFAHPDVDALVERLAAAAIQPTDRVDDGRYRRVYFADPDGHVLEFVQQLG